MKDGRPDFNWFNSQEEMQDFIDNNKLDGIFGAMEIIEFKELDVDFKVGK
jgi:hypothetical protein